MAGTKLSDIIVPELFNPYVINQSMEKSALIQSGIVTNNSEFDRLASQASPLINMPFYEDLTGESEQIIESVDLEDNKITSNKDVAAIIRRAKMWSATDLSAALSGKDPMGAIATLVANFWVRDMQKELVAILNGIFGSYKSSADEGKEETVTPLESNLLDITSASSAANKIISASSFIDAQQLLGDAQSQLTGVMMHSATWSYLKKKDLLDTVKSSLDTSFNTYQGKTVVIDDGCPVDNGTYTTYLFGQGAIALGNGNPEGFVSTEIDRDKKKGSGVDYLTD